MERLWAVVALLCGPLLDSARGTVTRCTNDTFGMAREDFSRPFERGVEELRCNFGYEDAAGLRSFVLNYYPSIEAFAARQGTDMVPERHFEYELQPAMYYGLQNWIPGKNGPTAQDRRIQLATCEIPQDDGGAYSIQRVGPLVSTGNYDYWQIGWHDVWKLSNALKAHPNGIMFTSSFSGPVDPSSRVLGHPPIHIHHIHITPSPGVFQKMEGGVGCQNGMHPERCYVVNLAVEQHGDYQCMDSDGGMDCLFERTADGHAKLLKETVDVEGELNDVRSRDAEPMTWWYQVVLRWFPRTPKMKTLSQHFIVGPGLSIPDDQRTAVLVFPVNTSVSSFYWYTGSMLHDGELARNKLHSHNTMFRRSLFFHATPEDLGLRDGMFWPKYAFLPLLLEELPFKDFRAIEDFLFARLTDAERHWDAVCPPSKPSCAAGRPALVCEAWVANKELVDPLTGIPFAYDRRAPSCCRPWSFRKGDPFTVVAFIVPLKTPPGPWMPYNIPPTGNMHIHWVLTYHTPDNESHYTVSIHNQNPSKQLDWVEGDLSRFPLWRSIDQGLFGHGRWNNQRLSLRERTLVAYYWLELMREPFWREVQGGLAATLVTLLVLSWHVALRCCCAWRYIVPRTLRRRTIERPP